VNTRFKLRGIPESRDKASQASERSPSYGKILSDPAPGGPPAAGGLNRGMRLQAAVPRGVRTST